MEKTDVGRAKRRAHEEVNRGDSAGWSAELGDGYVADVTGTVTYRDPVVTDADLPSHLKGGPAAFKNGSDDLFDW